MNFVAIMANVFRLNNVVIHYLIVMIKVMKSIVRNIVVHQILYVAIPASVYQQIDGATIFLIV